MVYRGLPSAACFICRTKRVKCDLGEPACGRCVKNNSSCEYRSRLDLMFRDQTQRAASKSHRRHRGKDPKPPKFSEQPVVESSCIPQDGKNLVELDLCAAYSPISSNPLPSLEDQASCFFFSSYVLNNWGVCRTYFEYLPKLYDELPRDCALSSIIVALGIAGLSRFQHAPSLVRLSRAKYAVALRSVNMALQDPESAKRDQTLIAIMLLGVYEASSPILRHDYPQLTIGQVTTSKTQRSITYYTKHIRGALALLRLRGKEQFYSPMGCQIFVLLRANITTSCLQTRVGIPQDVQDWTEEAAKHCPAEFGPATSLARLISRVSYLRANVDSMRRNHDRASIIPLALAIDADLDSWAAAVPPQWRYTTVYTSQKCREVFSDHYHMYRDHYIAGMWNGYRCVRVIVQEKLLEEYVHLHKLSLLGQQDAVESPYSPQIRASESAILEAVKSIYASVPQYLGDTPDFASRDSMMPSRAAACAGFLLWPLFTAGISTPVSEATRMWAAGRLKRIAEMSGIQQASFLAQAVANRDEVTEHLVEDVTQLPESDIEE